MKKLFFLISIVILVLTMVNVGFSASKSKIVYSNEGNIFTINSDGSEQVQLTNTTKDESRQNFSPSWSADGSKIAFVRGYFPRYDVWIMDANGENPIQLTNEGCNYSPHWSPNGDEITFLFDGASEDKSNIHIINSDGYGQSRLTDSGYCSNPCWHEDKIIFTYADDLYIMNEDGDNVTPLKQKGYDPSWSPDGTKILFVSFENSKRFLYTMDTDGQNIVKIVEGDNADWSPDGDQIVFSFGGNLFILNLIKKQIIPLNKKGANPSWSPNL